MDKNAYELSEGEKIIEIEIERLHEFKDHPFKVKDDQQMAQLKESISKYGILAPLIVRPLPDGVYEIISGHRRKYAAEKLGYRKLPVLIRVFNDDEAVVSMVDSNFHREQISPSEKAKAYKMKYYAMKRKAGRKKANTCQADRNLNGKTTLQVVGEEMGDSPKQVHRYLKITQLIPELMDMLDEGIISFNPAVEIADLKPKEQQMLMEAMEYTQAIPSLSQSQRLKGLSKEGRLTQDMMNEILGEVKKGEISRVVFKNEQLYRYFPKDYTPAMMKREILAILKIWKEKYWEE